MNKESLAHIIQLVELDQRIVRLEKVLSGATSQESHLTQAIDHIERELADAQAALHDAKKNVDALELEMKVVQGHLEKTKEKLMHAGSEKELSSLQSEQRSLEKKHAALDEQGFIVLNELEKAQQKVTSLTEEQPEKIAAKKKELGELSDKHGQESQLQESLRKDREKLIPLIPEDFRRNYDAMMKRVPNPVVPIVKDGCYGCFYGISRPELIKAQQGSLITCQGCYRMLYMADALENDEQQPSQ